MALVAASGGDLPASLMCGREAQQRAGEARLGALCLEIEDAGLRLAEPRAEIGDERERHQLMGAGSSGGALPCPRG